MFCMGIPMQFILVSNFIYHYQWLSLKKEVKDGMYHPVPAAFASWIVQAPMMFILAFSSLLPMYVIGDLAWSSFGIVLVLYALTFWSFEGLAQMLSTFSNVIIGLFGFLNLYFAAFLFCGMFVDPEDVIWPIRVFCYFMPLGWTLQSYMYALMHDMPDHSGTFACAPGDELPPARLHRPGLLLLRLRSERRGVLGKDGDTILERSRAVHHLRGERALRAEHQAHRRVRRAHAPSGTSLPSTRSQDVGDGRLAARANRRRGGSRRTVQKPRTALQLRRGHRAGDVEMKEFDTVGEAGTARAWVCVQELLLHLRREGRPDVDVLRDVSGSVQGGSGHRRPVRRGQDHPAGHADVQQGPGAPSGEISLNGKKMTR